MVTVQAGISSHGLASVARGAILADKFRIRVLLIGTDQGRDPHSEDALGLHTQMGWRGKSSKRVALGG